ncbi:MAG TPA: hypothetical protein PKC65_00565 [Pyrinomonadaceae bacterium]|nr:hypothetical protein [Pyrinomonadaceae bacterium]
MNFVKRFVPFVAAFAVGIFVASFFVDLRGPERRPRPLPAQDAGLRPPSA